jgi:hypothetical protein
LLLLSNHTKRLFFGVRYLVFCAWKDKCKNPGLLIIQQKKKQRVPSTDEGPTRTHRTPFISALGQRFHTLTICIMNRSAQLFKNPKGLHRWIHHDNLFKKTCIVYMLGFEYFSARPSWKHPLISHWKNKEKREHYQARL